MGSQRLGSVVKRLVLNTMNAILGRECVYWERYKCLLRGGQYISLYQYQDKHHRECKQISRKYMSLYVIKVAFYLLLRRSQKEFILLVLVSIDARCSLSMHSSTVPFFNVNFLGDNLLHIFHLPSDSHSTLHQSSAL